MECHVVVYACSLSFYIFLIHFWWHLYKAVVVRIDNYKLTIMISIILFFWNLSKEAKDIVQGFWTILLSKGKVLLTKTVMQQCVSMKFLLITFSSKEVNLFLKNCLSDICLSIKST